MAKSIESLIKIIKELPDISQRKVCALIGATVGDAACRPLHWIYNQETLDNILGDEKTPEFWPESKSPFYTIPLGHRSCYNEEALTTMAAITKNEGVVDIKKICENFKINFGAGTEYDAALKRRKAQYDPSNRNAFPGAVEGPWIHGAVIKFLENYELYAECFLGDSEGNDLDAFCAALPIVVKLSDKDNMWEKSSEVVRLFSTHSDSLKFMEASAYLVQAFIQGVNDPITQAKKNIHADVLEHMLEVEANLDKPFIPTVAKFGKTCSLPGSFKGAYLCLLSTGSFVDAIRLNITAGGCNCSRGNLIGAAFGAKFGIDGIPVEWLNKVDNIENIVQQAIEIYS